MADWKLHSEITGSIGSIQEQPSHTSRRIRNLFCIALRDTWLTRDRIFHVSSRMTVVDSLKKTKTQTRLVSRGVVQYTHVDGVRNYDLSTIAIRDSNSRNEQFTDATRHRDRSNSEETAICDESGSCVRRGRNTFQPAIAYPMFGRPLRFSVSIARRRI